MSVLGIMGRGTTSSARIVTIESPNFNHPTKPRAFDRKFDKGEDVTRDLDLSRARKPLLGLERINVDFPAWVVEKLDREASRLGVPRQTLIKVRIADRLKAIE